MEMSALSRCTYIIPSCQVKIFEEDFQRERSDRERMNEEKEELKQQLEKLQKQLVISNNQVSSAGCHWEPGVPLGCVLSITVPVLILEQHLRADFAADCPCQSTSLASSFSPSPGRLGAHTPFCRALHQPLSYRHWGWQGGLCTNPPCSQLRASKDDCQREKEEKEKLKKLLKQHKQVGMGQKPFLGEGLGASGLPQALTYARGAAPSWVMVVGCPWRSPHHLSWLLTGIWGEAAPRASAGATGPFLPRVPISVQPSRDSPHVPWL